MTVEVVVGFKYVPGTEESLFPGHRPVAARGKGKFPPIGVSPDKCHRDALWVHYSFPLGVTITAADLTRADDAGVGSAPTENSAVAAAGSWFLLLSALSSLLI